MIPLSVKLRGFLCYKEETRVDFSGKSLWLLSGLNGSGKSAVFDAVTYALFGHHRGGSMHAHELINKETDGLAVEFDFLLDGQDYRIKRTLKRKPDGKASSTQQIFKVTGESNGRGTVAVDGTGSANGFKEWVAHHVGLDYETFTSSVLLLQGRAEKLLDSTPGGRREVLASIVDLERYERLHRRADDRRKEQEAEVKALRTRLGMLAEVLPLELLEAKSRIVEAEEGKQAAREAVERLQDLQARNKQWQELQGRLVAARSRHEKARALLGEQDAILRAVARLAELREVLPHVRLVVELRGKQRELNDRLGVLQRESQKHKDQLAERESALKQARDRKADSQRQLEKQEASRPNLERQLREATGWLRTLQEYERHEAQLRGVKEELARLSSDPVGEVRNRRAEVDELTELGPIVAQLARLASRRDELRQAQAREAKAEQETARVEAEGKRLRTERDALKPQADAAAETLKKAADAATEARTLLTQAQQSLSEVTDLEGTKVCRHCGQSLTPGHVEEEKTRRGAEVQRAKIHAAATAKTHQAAQEADASLRGRLTKAEEDYQKARDEYVHARADLQKAKDDVRRLQEECGRAHAELPEAYRRQVASAAVAEWSRTTYPKETDLDALRVRANGLPTARQRACEAEEVQAQWTRLRERETDGTQTLDRLKKDLPADWGQVRRRHADLENSLTALDKAIKVSKDQLHATDASLDRLSQERDQARKLLDQTDVEIQKGKLEQESAKKTETLSVKQLPAAWQGPVEKANFNEMAAWTEELHQLDQDKTEERGRELHRARAEVTGLEDEALSLETQEAAFPAEAKADPASLAEQLRSARSRETEADTRLQEARRDHDKLEDRRREREQLDTDIKVAEKELTVRELLSELLGKSRLQLYLVRQAERQVVDHANAVLDRLSGGQLYLKLVGDAGGEGSSAKALDLEAYNRQTGDRPINVAFLSGSQKFRVAVSLALGIGQYASRQHRPIESVIIDEGFGCLDRQGRQVMIQELQNLRGQMRCILLVSHQEEFADAFPDGYHFRLESGATQVSRFQR